jgi:hypothetical protein
MGQPARSTIRASGVDRVVEALLAAPFAGAALVAAVAGAQPQSSTPLRVSCVVFAGTALVVGGLFARLFCRPQPRLRVRIGHDMISFHQRRRVSVRFRRADIAMVVIEQGEIGQTCSLSVYDAARACLGTWPTGWIAKPTMKVIATLERHGYPHAFRHTLTPRPEVLQHEWPWSERRQGAPGVPVPVSAGPDVALP